MAIKKATPAPAPEKKAPSMQELKLQARIIRQKYELQISKLNERIHKYVARATENKLKGRPYTFQARQIAICKHTIKVYQSRQLAIEELCDRREFFEYQMSYMREMEKFVKDIRVAMDAVGISEDYMQEMAQISAQFDAEQEKLDAMMEKIDFALDNSFNMTDSAYSELETEIGKEIETAWANARIDPTMTQQQMIENLTKDIVES